MVPDNIPPFPTTQFVWYHVFVLPNTFLLCEATLPLELGT